MHIQDVLEVVATTHAAHTMMVENGLAKRAQEVATCTGRMVAVWRGRTEAQIRHECIGHDPDTSVRDVVEREGSRAQVAICLLWHRLGQDQAHLFAAEDLAAAHQRGLDTTRRWPVAGWARDLLVEAVALQESLSWDLPYAIQARQTKRAAEARRAVLAVQPMLSAYSALCGVDVVAAALRLLGCPDAAAGLGLDRGGDA